MTIKFEKITFIMAAGLTTGFLYAGIRDIKANIDYLAERSNEPVIVAQPPLQPVEYLEFLDNWVKDIHSALLNFETQTLEVNQNPNLFADKKAMDEYSETINRILMLTDTMIKYDEPIEEGYTRIHDSFLNSAFQYNLAMSSMWEAATFYQLDVNYDIIATLLEKSTGHLKAGTESLEAGLKYLW